MLFIFLKTFIRSWSIFSEIRYVGEMSRNTENFIAPGRGVFIMHYLDFG